MSFLCRDALADQMFGMRTQKWQDLGARACQNRHRSKIGGMHVLVHEQFVKVTQFVPGGKLLPIGKLKEAVVAEKG